MEVLIVTGTLICLALCRISAVNNKFKAIRMRRTYMALHLTLIGGTFGLVLVYLLAEAAGGGEIVAKLFCLMFESLALLKLYVVYDTARIKETNVKRSDSTQTESMHFFQVFKNQVYV